MLVTIQVDMHDQLALTLQDELTTHIVQTRARGVLIDISGLEIVDSFIGRMLSTIAAMARVLDAETVVGMQPAVAITLVELGLSLTCGRPSMWKRAWRFSAPRSRRKASTMTVVKGETTPLQTEADIVRAQVVRQWASSRALAWWSRPRWSPRPVSWRAIP